MVEELSHTYVNCVIFVKGRFMKVIFFYCEIINYQHNYIVNYWYYKRKNNWQGLVRNKWFIRNLLKLQIKFKTITLNCNAYMPTMNKALIKNANNSTNLVKILYFVTVIEGIPMFYHSISFGSGACSTKIIFSWNLFVFKKGNIL